MRHHQSMAPDVTTSQVITLPRSTDRSSSLRSRSAISAGIGGKPGGVSGAVTPER